MSGGLFMYLGSRLSAAPRSLLLPRRLALFALHDTNTTNEAQHLIHAQKRGTLPTLHVLNPTAPAWPSGRPLGQWLVIITDVECTQKVQPQSRHYQTSFNLPLVWHLSSLAGGLSTDSGSGLSGFGSRSAMRNLAGWVGIRSICSRNPLTVFPSRLPTCFSDTQIVSIVSRDQPKACLCVQISSQPVGGTSRLFRLSDDPPPPLRGIVPQLAVGVDGNGVAHQFQHGDVEDAVPVGEALA